MKLTQKDKEFMLGLRAVMEKESLAVELKSEGWSRMVLRKNYGSHVESHFGLSRQGVRWRFHRIFSEMYVAAYMTILWIESTYGTGLREMALTIARERVSASRQSLQESPRYRPKDKRR